MNIGVSLRKKSIGSSEKPEKKLVRMVVPFTRVKCLDPANISQRIFAFFGCDRCADEARYINFWRRTRNTIESIKLPKLSRKECEHRLLWAIIMTLENDGLYRVQIKD